jgi:hypothetical protein
MTSQSTSEPGLLQTLATERLPPVVVTDERQP